MSMVLADRWGKAPTRAYGQACKSCPSPPYAVLPLRSGSGGIPTMSWGSASPHVTCTGQNRHRHSPCSLASSKASSRLSLSTVSRPNSRRQRPSSSSCSSIVFILPSLLLLLEMVNQGRVSPPQQEANRLQRQVQFLPHPANCAGPRYNDVALPAGRQELPNRNTVLYGHFVDDL